MTEPIRSARQVVADAEEILCTLHEECSRQEAATMEISGAAPTSATLVNLMANMSQEIQQYQEESSMGPALHAARQVAYWSSVFVSMVSNEATIPTTTSHSSFITDHQPAV